VREGKAADYFSRSAVQFVIFALVAVALRCATFGDLSRHADEGFYFLVGQRMHEGVLPYVDVWDRKPLGLFLIYYLIAGVSTSVLSYQIAACLAAAGAATIISCLAARWSSPVGGALAGIAYLLSLGAFEGATGQTPDFYNPLIAGAALLLVGDGRLAGDRVPGWRTWCAMGLCGLALTIKPTTLFEAAFFGFYALWRLWRGGASLWRIAWLAAVCALIGAAPTLLISLFYFAVGHWHEYWQAMVVSNLVKAREGQEAWRSLGIVIKAAPLLVLAIWGLLLPSVNPRARAFIAAWTCVAVIGFASVPNFYGHYALPVLVPLSVAAGLVLARQAYRSVLLVAVGLYSLIWYNPVETDWTQETNRAMREMANVIRRHDQGGGLVVFDGPIYLYALAGERFLSPLVFPQHLNHHIENNVSHLDTRVEIDRIVAARPGVIVISYLPRSFPVNRYARTRILDYARRNCRVVSVQNMHEDPYRDTFIIFGDCAADTKKAPLRGAS
jgi:hypothetical protein